MAAPRSVDTIGKRRRLLNERAINAAKRGDWNDALAANEELRALDPMIPEVQNRIGKAYSELGRFGDAYAAYARTIEIEPHNLIALRNVRRLEGLREMTRSEVSGHPLTRSTFFIEETGKTATVSLVRPAPRTVWQQMMPGDPLELRIIEATGKVEAYSDEGVYLGEIEPRIGDRIADLAKGGNRYTAAVVEHEEDTLRIMLRESFQDPSLSDRLSFPTRVRGSAPRAYIRKDILFDALEDGDLLSEGDDDEVEETDDEPEIEDEEFTDEELDESGI